MKQLLFLVLLNGLFALNVEGQNLPDLINFMSHVSNSSPLPQETVSLYTVVRNVGSSSAGASKIRFYLSSNNSTWDVNDTEIASANVRALAAYPDGVSVNATATIPSGLVGTHYIIFKVDADNQVTESNETNNTYNPQPIYFLPDLVVTTATVPSGDVSANTNISVSASVKNLGNLSSGSSTLKYWISSNATLGSGDNLLGTDAVVALAANASSSESATLTIPANRSGTQYILFEADGGNAVNERSENNNVLAKSINVLEAKPDLVTSSENFTPYNGQLELDNGFFDWQTYVDNIGTLNLSTYAEVSVYFSSNSTYESSDFLVESQGFNGLNKGSSVLINGIGRTFFTGDINTGTYNVFFVVDDSESIDELDEDNNVELVGQVTIVNSSGRIGFNKPGLLVDPSTAKINDKTPPSSVEAFDLELFPNSTKGPFIISYFLKERSSVKIQVVGLDGKVLLNNFIEVEEEGTHKKTLNVDFESYKIALLKIQTNEQVYSRQISIKD